MGSGSSVALNVCVFGGGSGDLVMFFVESMALMDSRSEGEEGSDMGSVTKGNRVGSEGQARTISDGHGVIGRVGSDGQGP